MSIKAEFVPNDSWLDTIRKGYDHWHAVVSAKGRRDVSMEAYLVIALKMGLLQLRDEAEKKG